MNDAGQIKKTLIHLTSDESKISLKQKFKFSRNFRLTFNFFKTFKDLNDKSIFEIEKRERKKSKSNMALKKGFFVII